MTDLDPADPWTDFPFVAVDVEGNGQQPPDLVEFAAVPITRGTIGLWTTWLVRPTRPILPIAQRWHRISDRDVAACPPVAEVQHEMRGALDGAVFVAHNAHVDLGVLTRELPGFAPAHVVDTLRLARQLLPGLASYRLGALADALGLADGLPTGLAPHRATYDALVCARLLVRLASEAPIRTIGELVGKPPKGSGDDAAATLF